MTLPRPSVLSSIVVSLLALYAGTVELAGRADRGAAVIEAALAALGGRERVAAAGSWQVEGRGRENLTAEIQGLAPDRPTWRPHEERLMVDAAALAVAWQRRTPRNDHSVRWRRLIYRPDSSGFVDFVTGGGGLRARPAAEARRRGLARRVPHLLLAEVAGRGAPVWRGERTIGGRTHDVVVARLDGEELTLALARAPARLASVEFRRHQPTRGDVTVAWRWHGWRPDPALGQVPSGHRVEVDGTPFQEVTYTRFVAPAPDRAAMLGVADAPGATAAPPAPPTGLPAAGEVAPGVHVESFAGLGVMIAEFDSFLVVVEAPDASPGLETIPAERPATRASEQCLAMVRERFPGKPVRYLVVSHHHGDHMGGIRAFAAAGARLLVAPGHRGAARAALAAPHALAPDGWEGGADRARIETVATRRVIGDGRRTLEVLNVGRNPHTDENLFVWLPAERIAFQGDLFYESEGDPFPPSGRGRMNRFFARWLRDHGIAPRAVYGVHNDGASGPARLAEALALPD